MSKNYLIIVIFCFLIFTTLTIGDAQKDTRNHNNQSTFGKNEYNLNEDGKSNTNLIRWNLEPLKSEKKTQLKLNIELMIVNETISNYSPEIIIIYNRSGNQEVLGFPLDNGTHTGYIEVDINKYGDYPFEWGETSIYIKGGSLEYNNQTLDIYIDEPYLKAESFGNEIEIIQLREDASTSIAKYYVGFIIITIINLGLLCKYLFKNEISDKYIPLIAVFFIFSQVALGENLYRVYIYSLPVIFNCAMFIILPIYVIFFKKRFHNFLHIS